VKHWFAAATSSLSRPLFLPFLYNGNYAGTVGNMQVFHGTLSVRGKETVMRASAMVAWTVVVEILLVCTMFIHVMGIAGFADFVKFVFGLG
jgi:hypothetical protein